MTDNRERKRVLILCTGNSARSQMAEGLLRHLAGPHFEVFSAGVEPSFVRPQAIEAMNEIGIDISQHRSKSVDEFLDKQLDYVITVCDHASRRCPVFPGTVERIHWSIDDPVVGGNEEAQLEAFRRARDELQRRLQSFVDDLAPARE
ncbi:MAG TPA: arsenate reductase ArsC [Pyrinomonadaceae bacterium]|nr:arsenate reductase ArsC [Pyrinomonadaceae bacterium]